MGYGFESFNRNLFYRYHDANIFQIQNGTQIEVEITAKMQFFGTKIGQSQ